MKLGVSSMAITFQVQLQLYSVLGMMSVAAAVCPANTNEPSALVSSTGAGHPFGYLFAYTTRNDYHRLYYAVSRDGLRWKTLNGHKRILGEEYCGLPEICCGYDGRFYLLSRQSDVPVPCIGIWVSDDLVSWQEMKRISPRIPQRFGFQPDQTQYYGAPKMFYDVKTRQHVITFHATPVLRVPGDPWRHEYWQAQRTYYVSTMDFREFTVPERLMPDYDFPTIDVIIRRDGERYFIIMKDERERSSDVPTGKALRVASGPSVTGPWSEPSDKISPYWREAPAAVQRVDGEGWYIYFEHYAGKGYSTVAATSLSGPWVVVPDSKQEWPDGARHGCVLTVNRTQWGYLHKAFGD